MNDKSKKLRELKNRVQALQEEILELDKEIEEIRDRAPRQKAAAEGKYYPGTIGYTEPGEEKVRYVFPADEYMKPAERDHEKLLHKRIDQKRDKQKDLEAVQGEVTKIELDLLDDGVSLAALDAVQTDQQPQAGRPISDDKKKRCEIVLEVTQATSAQEVRNKLKNSFTVETLFQRLDEEGPKGVPLPEGGKVYKAEHWSDLARAKRVSPEERVKLEEIRLDERGRALRTIRRDMRRYFAPDPAK